MVDSVNVLNASELTMPLKVVNVVDFISYIYFATIF
jgi:hypothetical protein